MNEEIWAVKFMIGHVRFFHISHFRFSTIYLHGFTKILRSIEFFFGWNWSLKFVRTILRTACNRFSSESCAASETMNHDFFFICGHRSKAVHIHEASLHSAMHAHCVDALFIIRRGWTYDYFPRLIFRISCISWARNRPGSLLNTKCTISRHEIVFFQK